MKRKEKKAKARALAAERSDLVEAAGCVMGCREALLQYSRPEDFPPGVRVPRRVTGSR